MALRATGQTEVPEFRERLGRLNAVLKSFVKGRRQEGFEQVHVVAAKANVSEEWLYNVLESRIWSSERQVVYIFVEIRQLMERNNDTDEYFALNFYCD